MDNSLRNGTSTSSRPHIQLPEALSYSRSSGGAQRNASATTPGPRLRGMAFILAPAQPWPAAIEEYFLPS